MEISFIEVATAKRAQYIDALSREVLLHAKVRLQELQAAALATEEQALQ